MPCLRLLNGVHADTGLEICGQSFCAEWHVSSLVWHGTCIRPFIVSLKLQLTVLKAHVRSLLHRSSTIACALSCARIVLNYFYNLRVDLSQEGQGLKELLMHLQHWA